MSPRDLEAFRFAFVLSPIIVAVGSLVAAVLCGLFVQKRYEKRVAETPDAKRDHELALLMYAGSLMLWPLGLAFTITLKEARTARTCGLVTIAHFTFIALATCAAFIAAAAYDPFWR